MNLSNEKISKYGTFGIHQDWVDQYLSDPESFFDDNLLGKKQIPSFKAWLKDAEIIDGKCKITPFGQLCKKINDDSATLLWELIHVNLTYNSPIMRWFVSHVDFNTELSRRMLDQMAIEYFQPMFKVNTITYAIQALVQSFKYSPIGSEFRQFIGNEEKSSSFQRLSYNDLSPEAIAYSLYRYARAKGINILRLSELYRAEEEHGPYREFGVERNDVQKKLRHLSSEKNRVLIAELNMGLDHITLRDDLSPLNAVQSLIS